MMKKVFNYKNQVGLKSGEHVNWRNKYNCNGKYNDEPIVSLWEEEMVFNPSKDFEYETVVKV